MGNVFSNGNYNRILDRVHRLEEGADLNRDGLVTKEELKEYSTRELKLRDTEILSLREEILELREQKRGAVKKAKEMSKAYDALYAGHEAYLEMIAKEKESGEKPATSVISSKAVDRFVDELLSDPNINIYLLPDSVEKPLYANTLKIILSILQKMFNNVNIDVIGHEFKMRMQPTLETRLCDGSDDDAEE